MRWLCRKIAGQSNLINLIIIGELKIRLAFIRHSVTLSTVTIRTRVIQVIGSKTIRTHIIINWLPIQKPISIHIFPGIQLAVKVGILKIPDTISVKIAERNPVAIIIDSIFLTLIHHAIAIIIEPIDEAGALQEGKTEIANGSPLAIQEIQVPLPGDIVDCVEEGRVILSISSPQVGVYVHAHDVSGQRLRTDIFYLIDGNKDIFSQWMIPLVVTHFYFKAYATAGPVQKR